MQAVPGNVLPSADNVKRTGPSGSVRTISAEETPHFIPPCRIGFPPELSAAIAFLTSSCGVWWLITTARVFPHRQFHITALSACVPSGLTVSRSSTCPHIAQGRDGVMASPRWPSLMSGIVFQPLLRGHPLDEQGGYCVPFRTRKRGKGVWRSPATRRERSRAGGDDGKKTS